MVTQKVIEELVERGKRRGFITAEEVRCELVASGGSVSEQDRVVKALEGEAIEVIEADLGDLLDGSDTATFEFRSDSVQQYLNEIGRVPLLTQIEEVTLGIAKDAGLEAQARLSVMDAEGRDKSDPEYRNLVWTVRRGEQARLRLVESNLRLVVSIARRYLGPGVSILDLVQEGNVGLMKAAARYDYRRGFKFSTFAVWSIRQFVGRALNDQRRMIRLPINVADTLQVMVASGRRLSQELGRPPTTEELGADLDLPVEKVRKITEIAGGTLSLDATLDSHDDLTLGQVVADRDAESPGESIAQQLLQEKVALALEQLADREREVVLMRFGLADGQVRTLQEVSREMGVTKERIRQMETRALEKLRSSGTSGSMESYLRGA